MKLFKWEDFKFKFLNVTLFKIGQKKCRMFFFLFGIPVFEFKIPMLKLYKEIKENTNFDMRCFDEQFSNYIKTPNVTYDNFSENKIAYIATELYDVGGHTKCIETLTESLVNDYDQCLFLTKKVSSYKNAPVIIDKIEKNIKVCGIDKNWLFFEKQVQELYDQIISFGAKTLFVYIHPDDVLGTAILSLIKKTTDIKIIFFNHASHYPNLGMTFADLILEGMPTTLKVTNERRHLHNAKIIGLQSKAKDETVYCSKEEISEIRKNIGITNDELMTVSGGSSYKFFDEDSSEYFEMIKELFFSKDNLKHVILTNLKKNQKEIVDKIFANTELRDRLIILPLSPDFEKFFQAADLYIDSFPVSSALTQIDLMRLKVPTVVKINTKTPEFSFHEYMPPKYPYMFEKTEEFLSSIIYLLENKEKREEIIKLNYEFWLNTYEKIVVKNKYLQYVDEVLKQR